MENALEMGVVQKEFDRIGGNYAPENSHVSQDYLTGLTPPSFEQFNDQTSLDFQDHDVSLWGSFSVEDTPQNNFIDASAKLRTSPAEEPTLTAEERFYQEIFEDAPVCPDWYVDPPSPKRRRFNSDSTATSTAISSTATSSTSNSCSSVSTTQEIVSPITESLAAFSQQDMSTRKAAEATSSTYTTPKVTSETIHQQAAGQHSPISQVSSSGLNNSSNSDLLITSSNSHDTDPQTLPIINQPSLNNTNLSLSSTNAIATPDTVQTASATHLLSIPESHRIVEQQPCGVTGAPLPPIQQMHLTSNFHDHQVSPQQPRSPRRPFTAFLPAQNLGFTPFRRSLNKNLTSAPRASVQATQQPMEPSSSLHLPSRPTSNTTLQHTSPQALDRSSIKPQLRELMEKFEMKIRMDNDLREAFNIFFPARSAEVEQLKQQILNERHQAMIRENSLKKEIREFQENATNQDALQRRAMDLLTQRRVTPQGDRSWLCLNYNKNGEQCNNISKEYYLSKKVWVRRERCRKCQTKTFEINRIYFDNDEAVAAWTLENNVTPAMSNTPRSLKRTRDIADETAESPLDFVGSTRRKSLPTLAVTGQDLQESTGSRWASLPPHTKDTTRDHAPLYNSKSTQETLRAVLGAPPKAWMQAPKQIETIVLDDDSDEVETDQSQESSDDSPAVEQETNFNDAMEADFEADLEAGFEANLEADLEAELTAALEAELAKE